MVNQANKKGSLRPPQLKQHQVPDIANSKAFDRLTESAALICETPVALVLLLDGEFKSMVGLEQSGIPGAMAICNHTITQASLFEVPDLLKDPRFETNPLVSAAPHARFYAGVPLIDASGQAMGTLCVMDLKPRQLTGAQKHALTFLAEEAVRLIVDDRNQEDLVHFERVFKQSGDLICVITQQGDLVKVNPAFERFTAGRGPRNFFDPVHKEDAENTIVKLNKITTDTPSLTFSNRYEKADHTYAIVEWKATREASTGNLIVVGRDITLEKEKDLILEVSEHRFRSFFENSQGLMCTHDTNGKFITVNSAGADQLGYSVIELKNMSLFDLVPPELHKSLKLYLNEIRRKQKASGILNVKTRNGETKVWMFNNVYEKGKLNNEDYIIGNAIDITERYHLEKDLKVTKKVLEETNQSLQDERSRLRAFVTHAPAAVAMFDQDVKYVAVSNRWIEEYRLADRPIIGLSHYEVFPNVSQEWKDIHTRCLNGAVEKRDEDIWRPQGWNHDQYLKWEVRPWYLFDGSVGGIMMFTQDITDVCLQREELKLAKRNAEEASLAKSEFLANMSHEIRTPLNGVIGFTDLLLKTALNETQKQYLSIVDHSGNALLSIINDILDFSKIEAGKLELDIEKGDIYEVGSQAADIISYQIQNKGLEMLLNISNDLPRFVWADQVRLKQVLINLLSNAAKFTEKGEIELKIIPVSDAREEQVTIRFEVRDTGIGIRPENQAKIFEAFRQEDTSTTKKYGGTGLGLAISNKLLELMDSHLQLESAPGKGSRFYFDMTLKAEQGEPIQWDGIEKIKHVLIVDDNDNNRMILRQMLMLKQITSQEARNGIEALTLLSAGEKYDVIFMDYHMPIMDGLETIKKIRNSFYASAGEQPIILLYSSSSDETVIRSCDELDVNYRIVKPIKMREMYQVLSRLNQSPGDVSAYSPEHVPQLGTGTGNINILLVEDNQFNLLLITTIVQRIYENATIVQASNGLIAVDQCRQQLPDIIFMDIQMPEMNGYEATRLIRQLSGADSIPIIALTAGNIKGEKEKCLDAGMNDFLGKPFVEDMVVEMFRKWITVPPDQDLSR